MLQSELGQFERYVGLVGNLADVVDAVDLGDDLAEREVPAVVDDFKEVYFCDGDVPGFDGWGVLVCWEELHVDGVCVILLCQ